MPILDIEIVSSPADTSDASLSRRLADAAAAVFGAPAGRTWVRVRRLADADYGEDAGGPPPGVQPVFVRILKAEVPEPGRLAEECAALADAIGKVCGRPAENVHILYEPHAAGRIAFGGKLFTG